MRRIAFLLLAFALANCDCAGQKSTQTLEPVIEVHAYDATATPAIGDPIGDTDVVDFGAVKVGRASRFSLAILNSGDSHPQDGGADAGEGHRLRHHPLAGALQRPLGRAL
ncbi:MAG: hypothetical protein QM765_40050 [Myxococcales bacterium]